jgi:hypothetical protein
MLNWHAFKELSNVHSTIRSDLVFGKQELTRRDGAIGKALLGASRGASQRGYAHLGGF